MQEILRLAVILLYLLSGLRTLMQLNTNIDSSALAEALCTIIFLIATVRIKFLKTANQALIAVLPVLGAIALPLLFDFKDATPFYPAIGIPLSVLGVSISTIALYELSLRFDILPSYRGLAVTGIYGIIRHPMYSGYSIGLLGANLAGYTVKNIIISFSIFACLIFRIRLEENFLSQSDQKYLNYKSKVQYRILPGVF